MASGGILSIGEVNALPLEQFEWLFGNVIEHCPEAACWVAEKRPFTTAAEFKLAFDNYLDELSVEEREDILNKHPDLAGKLADEGKLTTESLGEQKSAGLDAMSREEKQTLNNLNAIYKEKFQFPFVICARENKVATILNGIEKRLRNSREKELIAGIEEVKKICGIRLRDLVWPDA